MRKLLSFFLALAVTVEGFSGHLGRRIVYNLTHVAYLGPFAGLYWHGARQLRGVRSIAEPTQQSPRTFV
jgi:hypothetical protein